MTIADKLTLLASSKEALRVKLGLPESLPLSEYYKHSYPFDPLTLFAGGKQGVWYDPSDISTLYQDAAGTVPVTKDGDPVALMPDKSGNGNHATQSVSTARPVYKNNPARLSLDKVDDAIVINIPKRIVGSMTLATTTGTATYGVDIPQGNLTLGGARFPSANIVGLVINEGELSDADKSKLVNMLVGKGAVDSFASSTSLYGAFWTWDFLTSFPYIDTSNVKDMYAAWNRCGLLTEFPLIDTSKCTNFGATWYLCINLTGFPALDFSESSGFNSTWRDCGAMVNFPPNMFDNVKTGDFKTAFVNTKLSQESIDGILVSLVASGITTGTRVFDQTGGSAPSSVGNAAIDTLRSRGWTVTVTGGY